MIDMLIILLTLSCSGIFLFVVYMNHLDKCIDKLEKKIDMERNLENIWHDASEEPKGTYIVMCDGLDNNQWVVEWIHIDMSYANWKDYAETIGVSRWAYVSELLPKGGEL